MSGAFSADQAAASMYPYRVRCFLCLLPVLFLPLACPAAENQTRAPRHAATPVNQLKHSKQACGPAALLNQFRCGDDAWQRAARAIPVEGETRRLRWIIGRYGPAKSKHFPGKPRFGPSSGISVADLKDLANAMAAELRGPRQKLLDLQLSRREPPQDLVRRVHRQIKGSLKRGTPPILQLRRVALRRPPESGQRTWTGVYGHFVTLVTIDRHLPRGANSFKVEYLDPWGGKRCHGTIRIPANDTKSPVYYLIADFPQMKAGLNKIRSGERHRLTCPHLLGSF